MQSFFSNDPFLPYLVSERFLLARGFILKRKPLDMTIVNVLICRQTLEARAPLERE
jgi:hypothetical protein